MITDEGVQGVDKIRRDDDTSDECVCPIPRRNIELFNIGKRAIKSHCVGKKYCERLALYKKTCQVSFIPLRKQSAKSPSTASSAVSASTHSKK